MKNRSSEENQMQLNNERSSLANSSATVLLALACLLLSTPTRPTMAEELLTEIDRASRTDTLAEKLELVQSYYKAGRFDMALSLVESMKDTIQCEKQLRATPGEPNVDIKKPISVRDLPPAWATWARGWQYVQPLELNEQAGMDRTQEPIDLQFAFDSSVATDLNREIRVAKVDLQTGLLKEVPSQVYDSRRRGSKISCGLFFFVDVPANGKISILVFYGNRFAERTQYPTDMKVDGQGHGLDITNNHFEAHLSRQTGQLERLRYQRQHGLELYAGGKGHGEPPTIDWSNDYVDQDHFQKLRIRNWSQPPNVEVVRGPLMVRVRRWGFPHSPIHPVFTPSRMHVDQTYLFYAGKDYFIKEGTMEAAKDFDFTTMRDDEWVLSGYSFTDKVWIDGTGHLREGDVPAEDAQNMWGVGFFHQKSRDAFIALRLQHSVDGLESLEHNGVPTLHYHQHGQLWSRYPVGDDVQKFKRGTVLRQRNAYLVAPYPQEAAAETIEGVRNRLMQSVNVSQVGIPRSDHPSAKGGLAREGETAETALLKPAIWKALRDVRDEQLYRIDSNVVDMGLIYDLSVRDGVVKVLMTMPHRGRPVYDYFVTAGGGRNTEGIRERLLRIDGVEQVLVDFTWNPAWTIDRLSPAGRQSLGLPQ